MPEDSIPDACDEVDCRSLTPLEEEEMQADAMNGYLNALLSGDSECINTFGTGFSKLVDKKGIRDEEQYLPG